MCSIKGSLASEAVRFADGTLAWLAVKAFALSFCVRFCLAISEFSIFLHVVVLTGAAWTHK